MVAFLGYYDIIGLSTFAVNLLTMLAIAAATDYAIFLVGRYHEARNAGEDREAAFYTMYHGTAHVDPGLGPDDRRAQPSACTSPDCPTSRPSVCPWRSACSS